MIYTPFLIDGRSFGRVIYVKAGELSMGSRLYGLVGVFIGAWVLYSVFSDSDFFFNHYKVKFFERFWGREGNRIFYGVLGLIIFFIALGGWLGALNLSD